MATDSFGERIVAVQHAMNAAGVDLLLLTPGTDLRYVTGYNARPLERLTCLVLPAQGSAVLCVPRLEEPAAVAAVPKLAVRAWDEVEDPYELVAQLAKNGAPAEGPRRVAVANHLWTEQFLKMQDAVPSDVDWLLAGGIIDPLRAKKSPSEIEALAQAAAAIDVVHAQVPALLRPGKTEREIAADIAQLIVQAGHAHTSFVIVASGPNASSPHHEPSDRALESGDVVVVDIGGVMPSGYCSDSTRTYALGTPPQEFVDYYAVLQFAQESAVQAVRPGARAAQIDAACREPITAAGYGKFFTHRTGHGIGLDTHEQPYIVAHNEQLVTEGMVFSVEPGIYVPGKHGARIEDIVVCTGDGVRRLNNSPRELVMV